MVPHLTNDCEDEGGSCGSNYHSTFSKPEKKEPGTGKPNLDPIEPQNDADVAKKSSRTSETKQTQAYKVQGSQYRTN